MNILLANHTPITGSGSGTYTYLCGRELARLGNQVTIFVVGVENRNYRVDEMEIVERSPQLFREGHKVFPSFTGHPQSALRYDDLSALEMAAYQIFLEHTLGHICVSFEIQVIHVQHLFELAAAALKLRLPTVVTSHGSELSFALKHGMTSEWYCRVKDIAEQCDHIIVVSNFIGGMLSSIAGASMRFSVVPSGYDASIFHGGDKDVLRTTVLMAGRFVSYKRFDLGILAFQQFVEESGDDKVTLTVGGGGSMQGYYESLIRLEHWERIKFRGFMSSENLAETMQKAWCLVVPSLNEPFGIVAVESLACGTPVIAAASGGLVEIVNETVGILVTKAGVSDWVQGLHRARSYFSSQRLYEQCLARAEQFRWDAIASQVIHIYRHAVANARTQ